MIQGPAEPCRLCGSATQLQFEAQLLGHHRVRYARCDGCGSLQTQTPTWLDEAYKDGGLSSLDTGAGQRNLQNLASCLLVARLLNLQSVVDFGGGDGLLCRLLRDRGLDARIIDRHAHRTYAIGFDGQDHGQPDLLTAFEVFEHFAQPRVELDQLFGMGPRVLLASSDVYQGQGSEWPYLSKETGQHVFFYTDEALQAVALRHGYGLTRSGSYWLFAREGTYPGWKISLARKLLKQKWRPWLQAWAVTRPTPGIMLDHAMLAQQASGRPRGRDEQKIGDVI